MVVLACFAVHWLAPDSRIWAYPVRSGESLFRHLAMIRGNGPLWTVPVEIQKWAVFHSSKVQNCTFLFLSLGCDVTQVWLKG